jgi:hypothetical protein
MALRPNEFDAPTMALFDAFADLEFLTWAIDIEMSAAERNRQRLLDDYREKLKAEGQSTTGVAGLTSRLLIPNLFQARHARVSYGVID